ncbi:MAG: hypothetical protein DRN27_00715 [Thermoplasmata archaeon]|nr:MAG: hypothetical protein DRN27_00715 [Thermoplasmata archaeon]
MQSMNKTVFSMSIILLFLLSIYNPVLASNMDYIHNIQENDSNIQIEPKYYALIGGCLIYENDSFSIASTNESLDSYHRYIYDSLLQSENWHEENIILLTDKNATRENVLFYLSYFAEIVSENDIFLFSWHSHGSQVEDTDGDEAKYDPSDIFDEVILPYDVEVLNGKLQNYISDDELNIYLDAFSVEAMVINVEACFSGGLVDEDTVSTLDINKQGRIILMSTSPNHLGWIHPVDAYGWMSSLGLMLQSPIADRNNDGWISVEEAFKLASPIYTFRTYFWYHLIPFMATSSLTYFALKIIQSIIDSSLLPNNILIFLSLFCGLYNVWKIEHTSTDQGLAPAGNHATIKDGYPGDLPFIQLPVDDNS